MKADERVSWVLTELEERRWMTAPTYAGMVGCAPSTARLELEALVADGRVIREERVGRHDGAGPARPYYRLAE